MGNLKKIFLVLIFLSVSPTLPADAVMGRQPTFSVADTTSRKQPTPPPANTTSPKQPTTFTDPVPAKQPTSSSSTIPWRQKTSFQFAKEISLSELIRGYFALQGVTVVVDPDIKGSVNGKFEDLSPEEFLNRLSRAYGLISYYNGGNVIYVYPAQKVESRFLQISSQASKKLLETVSSLGIVAPSSTIRLVGSTGIAFVSGPPGYVEMVSDVATQLSSILEENSEALAIKIFPLQHAWAYDTSFTTQDTRVTLPGLANVLRGLMETGNMLSPEMIVSGQITRDRIQVANKITTFNQENGLSTYHKKEILPINDVNPAILPPVEPVISTTPTLIQPDIRLNAIIVRDVEAKMPQYEAIIKALDIPVYLIEISVAIVDINTNCKSAIGNNFFSATNINDPRKNIAFSPISNLSGTPPLPTTSTFNFQLGAVWDGYQILSQIEALATEGYANILARPTVLTLNGLEAQISTTQTFYVPLIGVDASDLASVTVGTTLHVTPRVVEEKDGFKRIKLLIDLNDGNVDTSSTATTTLPRTTDASINTQAVIYEGQSLFIGGYYRTEKGVSETGIPILKDIPFIGYAFKIRTKTTDTKERMYLITPRIVNLDYERSPQITDQICDLAPPPMGIAHEMSKDNFNCEHNGCVPYAADIDCCLHPSKRCHRFKRCTNYFD